MPDYIELPQEPQGDEQQQIRAMYGYLFRMAQALNSNLAEIGGSALSDSEMKVMKDVLKRTDAAGNTTGSAQEAETLKSMIIKTAEFIRTAINQYNMTLTGSTEAEGRLGKYVRNTRLDVDVNPEGIRQDYTFREIIQGLKTYEINSKNYIKTGLLRKVDGIPVYGVAIGRDVVSFAEDGTETYNDVNKVAELTEGELSFWQNGTKVAGYTGNRISFYFDGREIFYIQGGKIYATGDLELGAGRKVVVANWEFFRGGISYKGANDQIGFQIGQQAYRKDDHAGILFMPVNSDQVTMGNFLLYATCKDGDNQPQRGAFEVGIRKFENTGRTEVRFGPYSLNDGTVDTSLGGYNTHFTSGYIDNLYGGLACQYSSGNTNFNNMKSNGRWWVSMSGMSNGPAGYTVGIAIVDVIKISDTIITQKIIGTDAIYLRRLANGAWGSWYKFAGTAV